MFIFYRLIMHCIASHNSSLITAVVHILILPLLNAQTDTYSSKAKSKTLSSYSSTLQNIIPIEGGTFLMGCEPNQQQCDEDEKPAHHVQLEDFSLGKYEVSIAEFETFLIATGYQTSAVKELDLFNGFQHLNGEPFSLKEKNVYPMSMISYLDAKAYCDWLKKETGLPFRLPTEAEWEFAARGGLKSKNTLFAGGETLQELGWYRENSNCEIQTSGAKKPNELGLYDMSGNVWEWCSDRYMEAYYKISEKVNPQGPLSGIYRVFRGGCWDCEEKTCSVTYRGRNIPEFRSSIVGFRVAMTGHIPVQSNEPAKNSERKHVITE